MLKHTNPLEYAIFLLKNRDYTENEINKKLSKKNFSHDEITKVIEKLKKENFIDDTRYIERFIENCIKKGMGPLYIKSKLIEKGISEKDIEDVLEHNPVTFNREYQTAKTAILKMFSGKKENRQKYLPKIYRLLCARGFSEDVIEKIIQDINGVLNGK